MSSSINNGSPANNGSPVNKGSSIASGSPVNNESEIFEPTDSLTMILRKTTSLPDLGTKKNPIVIEDSDSPLGSEFDPTVIYFEEEYISSQTVGDRSSSWSEEHDSIQTIEEYSSFWNAEYNFFQTGDRDDSSPSRQLQFNLETELIETPENWWEMMFRESDIILADLVIGSDYLFALDCQQTILVDDDSATARGTSVDSFLGASTDICPHGDPSVQNAHLNQSKPCRESINNEIESHESHESRYTVQPEVEHSITQRGTTQRLLSQCSVYTPATPSLEKRKIVYDEENELPRCLIKRVRYEDDLY